MRQFCPRVLCCCASSSSISSLGEAFSLLGSYVILTRYSDAYNVSLVVKDSKWVVEEVTKLPEGTQPQISVEELAMAEEVVKKSPKVQALMKEIGLTAENISCDGWSIGYDERFPANKRVQQALMFARLGPHENMYAHPLDFVPVLDSNSGEVLHIDFPAHRSTEGALSVSSTLPTPLADVEEALKASGRERIPIPAERFDWLPDLRGPNFKPREGIAPLHIIQPEGVSFSMRGNELEWQKWKMHIGASCSIPLKILFESNK